MSPHLSRSCGDGASEDRPAIVSRWRGQVCAGGHGDERGFRHRAARRTPGSTGGECGTSSVRPARRSAQNRFLIPDFRGRRHHRSRSPRCRCGTRGRHHHRRDGHAAAQERGRGERRAGIPQAIPRGAPPGRHEDHGRWRRRSPRRVRRRRQHHRLPRALRRGHGEIRVRRARRIQTHGSRNAAAGLCRHSSAASGTGGGGGRRGASHARSRRGRGRGSPAVRRAARKSNAHRKGLSRRRGARRLRTRRHTSARAGGRRTQRRAGKKPGLRRASRVRRQRQYGRA